MDNGRGCNQCGQPHICGKAGYCTVDHNMGFENVYLWDGGRQKRIAIKVKHYQAVVIVAGSRDIVVPSKCFENIHTIVSSVLNKPIKNNKELLFVHGGANGVDSQVDNWLADNDIHPIIFPYMKEHGRAGGPMRNKKMAKYAALQPPPGFLFAFWDGKSSGTRNMINEALDQGIHVHVEICNE